MTEMEDNVSPNPIGPGDWLEGPFWSVPVQVVSVELNNGYDVLSVVHPTQGASLPFIFTPDDWKQVRCISKSDRRYLPFSGDPESFRLGVQALRLKLAHSIDPYEDLMQVALILYHTSLKQFISIC